MEENTKKFALCQQKNWGFECPGLSQARFFIFVVVDPNMHTHNRLGEKTHETSYYNFHSQTLTLDISFKCQTYTQAVNCASDQAATIIRELFLELAYAVIQICNEYSYSIQIVFLTHTKYLIL